MRKIWAGIVMMALALSATTAYALHQRYQGLPVVKVLVNGNPIRSDVPPVVLDGRTLLPARAVAEALGMSVHWDPELSTVHLTSPGAPTPAISVQASAVIEALRDRDWNRLANLTHPDKGVRFSPYGHVKTAPGEDRVLTQAQIQAGFTDTTVYRWGHYDGTGDPIDLNFEDYYGRFVYSVDFASAPVVSYNSISGRGNTLINLHEVYPDAQFVEYHFPGFDPDFGGMDWQSLRLVFEEKDGNWLLIGIIHDQWTI